jgi:hypothetical protein
MQRQLLCTQCNEGNFNEHTGCHLILVQISSSYRVPNWMTVTIILNSVQRIKYFKRDISYVKWKVLFLINCTWRASSMKHHRQIIVCKLLSRIFGFIWEEKTMKWGKPCTKNIGYISQFITHNRFTIQRWRPTKKVQNQPSSSYSHPWNDYTHLLKKLFTVFSKSNNWYCCEPVEPTNSYFIYLISISIFIYSLKRGVLCAMFWNFITVINPLKLKLV